jgi:hypothetical protein
VDYRFYIDFGNGFESVQPPSNHEALKLKMLWGTRATARIESINLEWWGDIANKLNTYRAGGLTGATPGIYEGLRMRVETCTPVVKSFDFTLDLINKAAMWECDKVTTPMIRESKEDWFEQQCAAYSFWYLASDNVSNGTPGKITALDYKATPYAISEIPDYAQLANLAVTFFLIVWQIADVIRSLASKVTMLIGYAVAAAWPTNILLLLMAIVEIGIYIVYLIFLISEMISLLVKMIACVIQDVKFKLCMRERDLFQKLCQFLGLAFNSSIYTSPSPFENATWMPAKPVTPKVDTTNFLTGAISKLTAIGGHDTPSDYDRPANELTADGFPTPNAYGYFDGTFKEFIDAMCLKYDADYVIKDNVLYFENKHLFNEVGQYQLPNTG